MAKSFLERTYNHFEKITDPRVDRGANHPLIEMIFVALCATICGADCWADVERYGNTKISTALGIGLGMWTSSYPGDSHLSGNNRTRFQRSRI